MHFARARVQHTCSVDPIRYSPSNLVTFVLLSGRSRLREIVLQGYAARCRVSHEVRDKIARASGGDGLGTPGAIGNRSLSDICDARKDTAPRKCHTPVSEMPALKGRIRKVTIFGLEDMRQRNV